MAGGSSTSTGSEPEWYKIVGITLAVSGAFFTGLSFILQKKAHLQLETDGNGKSYLSSPIWWGGMLSLAIGEVGNFGAYAFQPAIVVAPLGALSVAVSALLSAFILKERLSFSGAVGVTQCILGSIVIVINAPPGNTTTTLPDFYSYVIQPGFLAYSFVCLIATVYLVFFVGPKYGTKHPACYLSVVAIVGAYLVLSAQGMGAAMVYSFTNWETDNQFKSWTFYPLLAFVILCVINQVNFLNKALSIFSPSVVAPINYVFFTTFTIISSAVLFRGFNVPSATHGLLMVVGFLVIVGGIALLFQYSLKLNKIRLRLSAEVEDINDAQEEEESTDQNPFKMMNQGIKEGKLDLAKPVILNMDSTASSSSNKGKVLPETSMTQMVQRPLEPVAKVIQEDVPLVQNPNSVISAYSRPPVFPPMHELRESSSRNYPEPSDYTLKMSSPLLTQAPITPTPYTPNTTLPDNASPRLRSSSDHLPMRFNQPLVSESGGSQPLSSSDAPTSVVSREDTGRVLRGRIAGGAFGDMESEPRLSRRSSSLPSIQQTNNPTHSPNTGIQRQADPNSFVELSHSHPFNGAPSEEQRGTVKENGWMW